MLSAMIYGILRLSITESKQDMGTIDIVYDSVDILLTFSYLLMLYGISDSVKKTIET